MIIENENKIMWYILENVEVFDDGCKQTYY